MGEIRDFKIPLIIPRKHKGATEVISRWNILCNSALDPVELGQFITVCSKRSCDRGLLSYVAQAISRQFKLDDVFIEVKFNYYLDRATPQFEKAVYAADCYCALQYSQTYYNYSMGIVLPVIIKDITTRQGTLQFEVDEPTSTYFEDLIDHVQKHGGIRIYPVVNSLDREALSGVIDSGRTAKDYLNILGATAKEKALGDRGRVIVRIGDVYNMYNLNYVSAWSK